MEAATMYGFCSPMAACLTPRLINSTTKASICRRYISVARSANFTVNASRRINQSMKPETRVEAKYMGRGTVKEPPRVAFAEAHFEDDVWVAWDDHPASWIGPSVLTTAEQESERR